MYLPIFFPSKFTSYFFHLTTNMKAFDVLDVNCRLYFFFILFPSPLCLQNKITVCSGASLVIGEYLKVEFTKKKRVCSFPTFFRILIQAFFAWTMAVMTPTVCVHSAKFENFLWNRGQSKWAILTFHRLRIWIFCDFC